MLMVDARGGSDARFQNIDAALMDLIYHDETALFINRTVGNGVTTYVENKLKLISEENNKQLIINRNRAEEKESHSDLMASSMSSMALL